MNALQCLGIIFFSTLIIFGTCLLIYAGWKDFYVLDILKVGVVIILFNGIFLYAIFWIIGGAR